MDIELENALKNGGIAIITHLVECHICGGDILVDGGQHCGFDAVIETIIDCNCPKCLNDVTIDFNKSDTISKESKFMSTHDFTEAIYNAYEQHMKD